MQLGTKLIKRNLNKIKRRNKANTQECRNCIYFKIVKKYESGYDWVCKLGPHLPAEQCKNYIRKWCKLFK